MRRGDSDAVGKEAGAALKDLLLGAGHNKQVKSSTGESVAQSHPEVSGTMVEPGPNLTE